MTCSQGILPYGYIADCILVMRWASHDVPDGVYPQGARHPIRTRWGASLAEPHSDAFSDSLARQQLGVLVVVAVAVVRELARPIGKVLASRRNPVAHIGAKLLLVALLGLVHNNIEVLLAAQRTR